MRNMISFVDKFRKSSESLNEKDEYYSEKKQLNSLYNYFSYSLLYLERLENTIKNINIMITDLNSCLLSFFKNNVKFEIITHISYLLNSFNDVRKEITTQIDESKTSTNDIVIKIKNLQNLCIKKKHSHSSMEHYEKKIKKLLDSANSNQKHLDKVIRNEQKLNKVKTDYLVLHQNIKKSFHFILENKANKVIYDASKNLQILLCYFSLMNTISIKLVSPLDEIKMKCLDKKVKKKLLLKDNCFLEDKMHIFYENKANSFYKNKNSNISNPFSQNSEKNENKPIKTPVKYSSLNQYNDKRSNNIFLIKSFLKLNGKSSKNITISNNPPPIFPQ